jgi:hypothetical protein
MSMFDWSDLMTPVRGHSGQPAYTCVIRILSTRRLSPQFQFSLSAAALGIYLYDYTADPLLT